MVLAALSKPRESTTMTAFEKALMDFPVGTKVDVPKYLSDWDSPQCNKVVCGHACFRDSEDDPIICVCLVSTHQARAGWFDPKDLRKE